MRADSLYTRDGRDVTAVLDLAFALHGAESSNRVVSWKAQATALAYHNEHGAKAVIAETARLLKRKV